MIEKRDQAMQPHEDHYNIGNWSAGYFSVHTDGSLIALPNGKDPIKVADIVAQAKQQGMSLPILLRFIDILEHRVAHIGQSFAQAKKKYRYPGQYSVVYPIKVNQQKRVVETIYQAKQQAQDYGVGLEAGSKPELLAVIAMSQSPGSLIICNGYKDRAYIRLALRAQQLGHQIFLVIEKSSELPIVLNEAKKMSIEPNLGLRVRLSSIGKGNWQNTGGEKSKFGLNAQQCLQGLQLLQKAERLHCLKLLHCHLGSQIANIRDIQKGLHECARFYAQLKQFGAPLDYVDVGGGLGVDYEGTQSRGYCSMNYSTQEYATNVIKVIANVCESHQLPYPHIISESGRALTAHHAVLIADSVENERVDEPITLNLTELERSEMSDQQGIIHQLAQLDQLITTDQPIKHSELIETFHEAVHWFSEAQQAFNHGSFSLAQRAESERYYHKIILAIRNKLNPYSKLQRQLLDELNDKLADKLFVNFSLFQSMPDAWGINQVFPILPIANIHAPLNRRVVIQDLTCDSDGRVDQYVDGEGLESTLPFPDDFSCYGQSYHAATDDFKTHHLGNLIAFFLVGAYQEILGDMHNLFRDTSVVDVKLQNHTPGFQLENPSLGDSVGYVLEYVGFESSWLTKSIENQCKKQGFTESLTREILKDYCHSIAANSYLISDQQ